MVNLCATTPRMTSREGGITFKPVQRLTGKHVGTCGHCEEIGRGLGLL